MPTLDTTEISPTGAAGRTVDDVFGQLVSELGGALGVLITELGLRTGIWSALRAAEPTSAADVSERTGIPEPLVREWLRSQAAAGYLELDPATERYTLPDAVAVTLLDAPGGSTVSACTELLRSMLDGFDDLVHSYQTDRGFGWDRRDPRYWLGTDALTRAQLSPAVIDAALQAMSAGEYNQAGGLVLDVGCGYGYPTRTLAALLPTARVIGIDYHARSVAEATALAAAEGVADRVSFQVAAASDPPGSRFHLVTFFDSLHDLGDPVGALRAARYALAPGGAVLICEAAAADTVAENLNPAGRMFYAVSALVCTPNALSQQQPGAPGEPLGTFAGAGRLIDVAHRAGFSRVRKLDVPAAQQIFLDLRP